MFTTVILTTVLLAAAPEKSSSQPSVWSALGKAFQEAAVKNSPAQPAKGQSSTFRYGGSGKGSGSLSGTIILSDKAAPLPTAPKASGNFSTPAAAPVMWSAATPKPRPGVSNRIATVFKECEYRYTGGRYKNRPFKYRLFEPRPLNKAESYPVLVWLHGYGETGSDNRSSLKYLNLVLRDAKHIDQYPFYILVVQCPPTNPAWFRSNASESDTGAPDDMLTVTYEILKQVMQANPIDQDRVYLMGVSAAGGMGCLEMAMRHPELPAAIVTMGSHGGDTSRVDKLANIPIWMFHNENDSIVPPSQDQEFVSAIRQANGNGKIDLTLFPSDKHNCWKQTLQDGEVMTWLLSQRRGGACWTPPGCHPWKWWHVLAVPCLFLLCVRLVWSAKRKSVDEDVD